MGLFSNVFQRRAVKMPTDDYWYTPFKTEADTGENVGVDDACSDTAIYDGIRMISEGVAQTPYLLYKRLGDGGKEREKDHYLADVIRWQANPYMTAAEFWEAIVANAVVRGNGYAEIERDRRGRVVAFWPLWAHSMTIEVKKGQIVYHYRYRDIDHTFPAEAILHLRGFSMGGLGGINPVSTMQNAVAFVLAVRKYGNRFFKNGAHMGGILRFPAGLSTKHGDEVKKAIQDGWSGLDQAHRLMVIEYGGEWQKVGVDPGVAQMIESRDWGVLEVARMLNIPPHKLKDLSNMGDHKIEEQSLDWLAGTLNPWMIRIEQRTRMILPEEERETYFAEFLREAQIRTNTSAVMEALAIGVQNGIYSRNEARAKVNMNPSDEEGADKLFGQLNMAPLSDLTKAMDLPTQPSADDEPGDARRSRKEERRIPASTMRSRLRKAWSPLIESRGEAVVGEWVEYINSRLEPAFAAGDLNAVADTLHEMWRLEGVGPGAGGIIGKKYADARMTTSFAKHLSPVIQQYARAIGEAAALEAGLTLTDDLMTRTEWIEDWVYNQGWKRAQSSIGELQKIARASSGGDIITLEGAEAVQANIMQRMSAWQTGDWRKAQTIARRSVTQADGYIARDIWQRAGITKLIWRNTGSETCAVCRKLNGRVVNLRVDQSDPSFSFVPEGSMVDPELGIVPIPPGGAPPGEDGRQAAVMAGTHILHPPLHGGCDCQIEIVSG